LLPRANLIQGDPSPPPSETDDEFGATAQAGTAAAAAGWGGDYGSWGGDNNWWADGSWADNRATQWGWINDWRWINHTAHTSLEDDA
jgi:hypothetical protein